jgi:hypothetical protein
VPRLIDILTRQIEGEARWDSPGMGTRLTLEFPIRISWLRPMQRDLGALLLRDVYSAAQSSPPPSAVIASAPA